MKYHAVMALLAAAVVSTACGSNAAEQVVHEDIPALEQPEEKAPAEDADALSFGEKNASGSAGSVLDSMAASFGQPEGGSEDDAGDAETPEYVLVDASEVDTEDEYVLLPSSEPEDAPLGVQVESQTSGNASTTGTKAGTNDSILNEILNDDGNSQPQPNGGTSSGGSGGGSSNGGGESQPQPAPQPPAQTPDKTGNGSRSSTPRVLSVSAPGTDATSGGASVLDVSNAGQGYVMLNYSGGAANVRFKVASPDGRSCTYVVSARDSYQAFPLTGGRGTYAFTVYEEAAGSGGLYAVINARQVDVALADSMLPYLYPNCYSNFNTGSACVAKAAELAKPCDTDLQVVEAVYHYCVNNIMYDDAKAASVQPGYAPTPDETLATGRGICFDYASLMTAMLRSQGIPTRLEVGYVGNLYHAWVSCYVAGTGWIDGVIQFDGSNWTLMDPTTAHGSSSGHVQELQGSPGYDIRFIY